MPTAFDALDASLRRPTSDDDTQEWRRTDRTDRPSRTGRTDRGVDEPTVVTGADLPTRVVVSPPGAHTVGARSALGADRTALAADQVRLLLDHGAAFAVSGSQVAPKTRALTRRGLQRKQRTVREVAARRAARKARHERRMEWLETARSVTAFLCLLGLLVLIVGMGAVAFMILNGQMVWQPVLVR